MSWQPEIDDIARRKALAEAMGGTEKVARQKAQGKLTVRERIASVSDPASFREIGALSGRAEYDEAGFLTSFSPTNFIFGRARIEGLPVVLAADDFTVRGGAADGGIHQKHVVSEQMANTLRLPLIRLIDGTGGGGSVKTVTTRGRTYVPNNPAWDWVIANLATVPVIGLVLGPVAGLGAARAVTSHYSLMVKGLSQLFAAGPPVVKRTGEDVDKEGLGSSRIHTRNGSIDDEVETEAEAFARARRFLSYLPPSVFALPPRAEPKDAPDRRAEALLSAIPRDRRKVYKMRPIIEAVVDEASFFEIGRHFGRSAITGLARLEGWPVAILANDPMHYGGGWTAEAAQKVARFVDLAETFHLPVVNLVDNPGLVIGTAAEERATVRVGARAIAAVYQATVPWCSVIIRKCFGLGGAAHANHARLRYRYAWPSGDWGSLPMEGGIEAAYRAELEKARDPEALRAQLEAKMNAVRSPFRSAEAFGIEDIIDPRETRPLLCEFANLAAPLREPGFSAFTFRP